VKPTSCSGESTSPSTAHPSAAPVTGVDRLVQRGLVERGGSSDRRQVLVRLTPAGLALVDEVLITHLAVEESLLAGLAAPQREQLAGLLRVLLVAMGDGQG
jgi:DNA-binding MarR family transcriptional regulator